MPMNKETVDIQSRRQFADYVGRFLQDFIARPDEWGRNQDIESFLSALQMSAIVIDNIYANLDEPFSEKPTWRLFAEMLHMASDYE